MTNNTPLILKEQQSQDTIFYNPPLKRTKTSFLDENLFQGRFFFFDSLTAQFSYSPLFIAKKDPHSYFYPWTPFLPATASHYALPFLTELQSAEEDSQDESPAESVPIRGKKASLVPLYSHCPYVVVCFLPTAVNNGLFFRNG